MSQLQTLATKAAARRTQPTGRSETSQIASYQTKFLALLKAGLANGMSFKSALSDNARWVSNAKTAQLWDSSSDMINPHAVQQLLDKGDWDMLDTSDSLAPYAEIDRVISTCLRLKPNSASLFSGGCSDHPATYLDRKHGEDFIAGQSVVVADHNSTVGFGWDGKKVAISANAVNTEQVIGTVKRGGTVLLSVRRRTTKRGAAQYDLGEGTATNNAAGLKITFGANVDGAVRFDFDASELADADGAEQVVRIRAASMIVGDTIKVIATNGDGATAPAGDEAFEIEFSEYLSPGTATMTVAGAIGFDNEPHLCEEERRNVREVLECIYEAEKHVETTGDGENDYLNLWSHLMTDGIDTIGDRRQVCFFSGLFGADYVARQELQSRYAIYYKQMFATAVAGAYARVLAKAL